MYDEIPLIHTRNNRDKHQHNTPMTIHKTMNRIQRICPNSQAASFEGLRLQRLQRSDWALLGRSSL